MTAINDLLHKYCCSSKSRQTQYSSISDQTMDPTWIGQKFIFDIPDKAVSNNGGYSLLVFVRSITMWGYSSLMGMAEVPFSVLQNENDIVGWFALRGTRASNVSILPPSNDIDNYGSIKLRVQWVHSDKGLTRHVISEIGK